MRTVIRLTLSAVFALTAFGATGAHADFCQTEGAADSWVSVCYTGDGTDKPCVTERYWVHAVVTVDGSRGYGVCAG